MYSQYNAFSRICQHFPVIVQNLFTISGRIFAFFEIFSTETHRSAAVCGGYPPAPGTTARRDQQGKSTNKTKQNKQHTPQHTPQHTTTKPRHTTHTAHSTHHAPTAPSVVVCFNCAVYEQTVKYAKIRKNFYKTS